MITWVDWPCGDHHKRTVGPETKMFFIFAIIFIIIIVITLLRTDQCLDLEGEQPAVVPGVGEAA